MAQHLAFAPSRNFSLVLRQGGEEESHVGTHFRILGILFVHAMDVCSGLEISLLKEVFEK